MTEEKLKESAHLYKEITELESLITRLKPLKEKSLKDPIIRFSPISIVIKLDYRSNIRNTYGSEEHQSEQKEIKIPNTMASFLYNQYLNIKKGELHHLKTKFSQL